jgi:hypothetical protein
MTKTFRVLPTVRKFGYNGKRYFPGDTFTVEDEEAKRLSPCDFLELVSPSAKQAEVSKVVKVAVSEGLEVQQPEAAKKRDTGITDVDDKIVDAAKRVVEKATKKIGK